MTSVKEAPVAEKTVGTRKIPLFAEQKKTYPRILKSGHFRRLKWVAMAVLLAFYWIAPWLRWDRGPSSPGQAILIDLPGARAYFLAVEIWPQEVYYLTGLLILAALSLFFASSLFGRVWCGFACWQTHFTDLFLWLEQLFEGDRNARMALDSGPWTGVRLLRKSGKFVVWGLVSLAFGFGFVLFFNDAPTIASAIVRGEAGVMVYSTALVLAFMCFTLAGFAREHVCIYMCPYARFQSAMLDEHSMIVSYEAWRGEPRGPLKGAAKGRPAREVFEGRGHCVDCRMCVQVCPTGIDIRNGSQLACIGCGLCVDACNSVMDRLGLPRGLISYDSSFNQVERARQGAERTRLIRPRTLVYLAAILVVAGAMSVVLVNRKSFDLNVLHDRAPLYTELSGGRLKNGYTFRILNMQREAVRYRVAVEGLKEAEIAVVGAEGAEGAMIELDVPGDEVGSFRLMVTAPKAAVAGKSTDIDIVVTDLASGRTVRRGNVFAAPER